MSPIKKIMEHMDKKEPGAEVNDMADEVLKQHAMKSCVKRIALLMNTDDSGTLHAEDLLEEFGRLFSYLKED